MADEEDYFLRQENQRQPEEHVLLPHLGQRAGKDAADVVVNAKRLNVWVGRREQLASAE